MEYLDILLLSNNKDPVDKLILINELKREIVNLNSRELYIFDGKYSFDISSLIIKKNCILAKIDFIRAIIFKDKVYLINLNNKDFSIIKSNIIDYLRQNNKNKKFHLNFIDCLFSEITSYFDKLIHDITPRISINNELIRSGTYVYNNFRQLQTTLLSLEYKIKELKNLTDELLSNENDIKELKLNEEENKTEEIEEMIENYSLKFQDLDNDVCRLTREMDNVQKLVNIDLAKKRNAYAIFNIYISACSLSLSIGSYIGSMFGMNLKNNYENSNLAFCLAFIISILIIILSIYIQFLYFRKFN